MIFLILLNVCFISKTVAIEGLRRGDDVKIKVEDITTDEPDVGIGLLKGEDKTSSGRLIRDRVLVASVISLTVIEPRRRKRFSLPASGSPGMYSRDHPNSINVTLNK